MKNVTFSPNQFNAKTANQMILFYVENPEKSDKLGTKKCELWPILFEIVGQNFLKSTVMVNLFLRYTLMIQ